MGEKQEEISKLELEAEELVKNIKELHDIVGSYKSAKESLESVKEMLEKLINSTKDLSINSHKIIDKLIEIGSAKIENDLLEIKETTNKEFLNTNSKIEELNLAFTKKIKVVSMILISGFSIMIILQIIQLIF